MGMLSDFLTLIKGTQTNIDGVLVGDGSKINAGSIGASLKWGSRSTLAPSEDESGNSKGKFTVPSLGILVVNARTSPNTSNPAFIEINRNTYNGVAIGTAFADGTTTHVAVFSTVADADTYFIHNTSTYSALTLYFYPLTIPVTIS